MAPPGRPKIVSTPSCSRLLISACASCELHLCPLFLDKQKGLPCLGGLRVTSERDYRRQAPTTTTRMSFRVVTLFIFAHGWRPHKAVPRSDGALFGALHQPSELFEDTRGVARNKYRHVLRSLFQLSRVDHEVNGERIDVNVDQVAVAHEGNGSAVEGLGSYVAHANPWVPPLKPPVRDEGAVASSAHAPSWPRSPRASRACPARTWDPRSGSRVRSGVQSRWREWPGVPTPLRRRRERVR